MERSNEDSNRGNGQDNGMRPQMAASTNVPQTNRQDDEWSVPPIPERRDIAGEMTNNTSITPSCPSPYRRKIVH